MSKEIWQAVRSHAHDSWTFRRRVISCLHDDARRRNHARWKGFPIQKVKEAYERLLKSDVKYRFSIDMASLK